MPPKNMISVTRKSHMPSEAAFFCCCASEKWCSSAGLWACSISSTPIVWGLMFAGLSCNGRLQRHVGDLVVVISLPGNYGSLIKIKGWRRRGRLPFQSGGVPGIGWGDRSIAQRPHEVNHGQEITHGQHAGAGGRK